MTALRPHPLHPPSLLVLLGLYCPLISKEHYITVIKSDETNIKRKNTRAKPLAPAIRDKLMLAIKAEIEADVPLHFVYSNLDEKKLLPIDSTGKVISNYTVDSYITVVRKKYNLFKMSMSEKIFLQILAGKGKEETLKELNCSYNQYHNVSVTMGIKSSRASSRVITPSFYRFMDGIFKKHSYKPRKL